MLTLRRAAPWDGRLLALLRGPMGLSASEVKRRKGALFVSGRPARTNRMVAAGEEIAVVLEEPPPDYPAGEGPLEVLYEDEALLVVDKPPGLWVHPTPGRQTGTLANRAAWHLRGQGCGVHIVTRLDRDTFGVVLLAKYAHVHALLSKALREGRMEKTYLAAVAGSPPENAGTVAFPIARRGGGSLLREVSPDGQAARTDYRLLARGGGLSLLELRPQTGRTHQLRVHCAALGCPILGDRDYGTDASRALSEALGARTQQLCAASLAFPHPLTGESMSVVSRQRPVWNGKISI